MEGPPSLTNYMALSEKARQRLADVRELEPTSNSELRDRWDMDSGKEVAAYLREELGEYTYRDDDSRIRAVDSAPDDEDTTNEQAETADEVDEGGQPTHDTRDGDDTREMQRSTAYQDPSVDATDSGTVNAGRDGNPVMGMAEPTREPEPAQEPQQQREPQEQPQQSRDVQAAGETSTAGTDLQPAERSGDDLRPESHGNPPCPSCGRPLASGEEFEADLQQLAGSGMDVGAFVEANAGADPRWACPDIAGCGYYAENGVGKRFNKPSGGWGKGLLAVGGLAAAGLVGAAGLAGQQRQTARGADPWDGI